jgi:hypothetical protein
MTSKIPLATVPTSVWEPLHTAFAALLLELLRGPRLNFTVSFEIDGFSPYPYIQAALNQDDDFVIEFTSNVYLEPDLSKVQIARLDAIGWRKPNGRNPNYTRIIDGTQSPGTLARYIVTTLRLIYELDEDVWIVFGDIEADFKIYSSDSFWHRLGYEGIVCLPGRNPAETVEGIS